MPLEVAAFASLLDVCVEILSFFAGFYVTSIFVGLGCNRV